MPIVFTGSTPGSEAIQSILNIPAATTIDYIRWNLTLNENDNGSSSFHLSIRAGKAKQGTMDFEQNFITKEIKGNYTINHIPNGKRRKIVYRLTANDLPKPLDLLQLNDNLFHLLENGTDLLIGNGGWSFTLNRTSPVTSLSPEHISHTISYAAIAGDTASPFMFHGRTPCREIAGQLHLSPPDNWVKIKWLFTFSRDTKTGAPATCTIWCTFDRRDTIRGTWRIVRGTPTDPDAVVHTIDFDHPKKIISLLQVGKNILLFLDNGGKPLTGNGDFSYTLDRRIKNSFE